MKTTQIIWSTKLAGEGKFEFYINNKKTTYKAFLKSDEKIENNKAYRFLISCAMLQIQLNKRIALRGKEEEALKEVNKVDFNSTKYYYFK